MTEPHRVYRETPLTIVSMILFSFIPLYLVLSLGVHYAMSHKTKTNN